LCYEHQEENERLQAMRPVKQEYYIEQACHIRWDFIVEVYLLSAGGEVKNQ